MQEEIFTRDPVTTERNNTIAILSYITIIGWVIALVMNQDKKDPFASFHLRQSLGLFLTGLAISFINIIPILGWLIWIVVFFVLIYMWITGLLNAINYREKPLPFLGTKYADWFAGIK